MSFRLHSWLLMTLLDKILPLRTTQTTKQTYLNQKEQQHAIKVPTQMFAQAARLGTHGFVAVPVPFRSKTTANPSGGICA